MRKFMYGIKEMLYSELEEIAHKGSISRSDIEDIDMMVHTIKNIMKICVMDNEEDTETLTIYESPSYIHEEDNTTRRMEELMNDSRISVDDKSTLRRAMDILRK